MTKLLVNNIKVSYPETNQVVLQDISFTLQNGELIVILGTSGCGKTTLLNLIAGFIFADSGELKLDDQPITCPGSDRGVVFQDDILLPWQNVQENIAFGLTLSGVNKTNRKMKVDQVLTQVGLSGFSDRFIWQLSGGQRQRVGIARALASDPKILLLDEPFGALDVFTREQMQELLLQVWKKTAKPILLITHDIEEAIFLATHLILMSPHPGRIVEHKKLNFSHRYSCGESPREIKSDPVFIKTREEILTKIFHHQQVFK